MGCLIEKVACCAHISGRVINRLNRRGVNWRRVDAGFFFEIGDVGQVRLIAEICNIYYELVRRQGGSLPSEGASAAAKFFMAKGFERENARIKAFPSP